MGSAAPSCRFSNSTAAGCIFAGCQVVQPRPESRLLLRLLPPPCPAGYRQSRGRGYGNLCHIVKLMHGQLAVANDLLLSESAASHRPSPTDGPNLSAAGISGSSSADNGTRHSIAKFLSSIFWTIQNHETQHEFREFSNSQIIIAFLKKWENI